MLIKYQVGDKGIPIIKFSMTFQRRECRYDNIKYKENVLSEDIFRFFVSLFSWGQIYRDQVGGWINTWEHFFFKDDYEVGYSLFF